ncbi:MAG: BON domain-containing protein [Anaerolineae bacterium]|nr:BON domain-containing protein [Anaerolineae bacterium]
MTHLKRSDEVIKASVVEHLYWDNRVDASSIEVVVDDGTVTLIGEVPSYQARIAAIDDANSVIGVTSVRNMLRVNYPNMPSDDELESNITSKLLLNPDLLSSRFNVGAKQGWVVLEGTVDARWKKIEAENEAASVRGVTGMTNKVAIVTTEDETLKPIDETIAAGVVDAINRNRKVNIDDVNVKVEDGDVILSGKVPTWEARAAAYQSAIYTFGVTHVDNNLAVTEPAA